MPKATCSAKKYFFNNKVKIRNILVSFLDVVFYERNSMGNKYDNEEFTGVIINLLN